MSNDLRTQTRQALAAAVRALRADRKARGLCIDCGQTSDGRARCLRHRKAASARLKRTA